MKKHSSLKRILAVCLSLIMVLSLIPSTAMAANSDRSSFSFEEIDPSEVSLDLRGGGFKAEKMDVDSDNTFKSTDLVRVMIVLPGEAAVSLVDEGMSASDPAVDAYREELQQIQEYAAEVISEEALGGEELDVVWNLTLAVNAISANVEYGQIEDIAKVNGVKAVYIERRYEPMTTGEAELNNIPAQNTTGAAALQNAGYTGAGMRIAVIDTGTAKNHQSFDAGAFEHSLQQMADEEGVSLADYMGEDYLNLLTAEEIARDIEAGRLHAYESYADWYDDGDFYISSKLPFGYNYIDGNTTINHIAGFDEEGNPEYSEHGSHVAGIAAANTYIPNPDPDGDDDYVEAATTVGVTGVAPDAQIITMKVFGANGGAYTSDNFAAIEDAMVLNCDVVNLSLGSSSGFVTARGEYRIIEGNTEDVDLETDRIDDWVNQVMDDITTHGIVMCVSAGNSGNWAEGDNYATLLQLNEEVGEMALMTTSGYGMMYTDEGGTYNVGSPSTFHNTMSVASADNVGGVSGSKTTFTGGKGSIDLSVSSTVSAKNPDWSTMDENDGAGTTYDVVFLGDPSTWFETGVAEDDTIYGGYDGDGDPIGDVDLTGKIVLVSRGNSVSFLDKRAAAEDLHAVAIICYNNDPKGGVVSPDLSESESTIPFGSVSYEDGKAIFDLCTQNGDGLYACTATVYGSLYVNMGQPGAKPNMSDFSSWGTTGALTIKPEITAPGGSIYSVNGGEGGAGDTDQYENMSGTSMAAPHFSGLVALTKQYVRDKGVLEKAKAATGNDNLTERQLVQSLLMSTAEPLVEHREEDGSAVRYSVRDQGAGLANVEKATSAKSFILVDGQPDGKVKAELGEGTAWTFSFTLYNLTNKPLVYYLSADMMTTGTYMDDMETEDPGDDLYFSTNEMVPLDADVSFSTGSLINVPASGSVKVTANVTVSQEAVDEMTDLGYEKGFYVEGYVYAQPIDTTGEGVQGVIHSIPMLGWYGSWTDISMFDGDALVDTYYPFLFDEELRLPHVFNWYGAPIIRNMLLVSIDDADPEDPEAAEWFTGNLYDDTNYYMYMDTRYIPARNALNNDGNAWWRPTWFSPMLMRNAIGARVQVVATTGVDGDGNPVSEPYYSKEYLEPFEGAYAHGSLGILMDTSEYNMTPIEDYDFSNIPEGTDITISFTYAPEYYENSDGSIRWNDLKDGATMSFPFRIDNTAPELKSFSVDEGEYGPELTIEAQDENYIAYVSVMDGAGMMWADIPVCPDMDEEDRGQVFTGTFDLSMLEGSNKAIVALADYAGNERFYALNLGDGSYPGGGYGDLVAFQSGMEFTMTGPVEYHKWVSFDADVYGNETAMFSVSRDFTSADYAGGAVYAQDSQGWLYGIWYDDMVNGIMDLDSTRIARLTQDYVDMAYNYADGKLYGLHISEDPIASYVDAIDLSNGCQVEENVYTIEDVYGLGLACNDAGNLYLMGPSVEGGTATLYVGTTDNAEARALYDLNGDYAVNVLDAQALMDHVIRGTDLAHPELADIDKDNELTTADVNGFLDILDDYDPAGEYHFEPLFDTELEMNYRQSMAWDHNKETLYWAHCDDYGYCDLQEIDVVNQTCTLVDELSTDTYSMFAPLTAANAAKNAHSNVPATPSGTLATPVLVNTALTLATGGSSRLTYDVSPWYADNVDMTWSSSDPAVATVSQSGLVTAVGAGTCTITVANADDPTLNDTCIVNVVAVDLTIKGTYSQMSGYIGDASGSKMYTFDLRDGSATLTPGATIVAEAQWDESSPPEPFNTVIGAAAKDDEAIWMAGGATGDGGVTHKVDPETGVASKIAQPLGEGDTFFGLTWSRTTGMFTATFNYSLFVDMPLDEFPTVSDWVDVDDPSTPALWKDMFDQYGYPKPDWHCIDLVEELTASDEGFNTGEYGEGSIVDVVLCGITDIGSTGLVTLENDYLGGDGATGSYTPTTTMVLLDNVGRLWYVDELMNMTEDGDGYTGTCGTVSGDTGIHTCANLEGTAYSVFVIREIVETPLYEMYWQDTMPRYTYQYSDIYYAGLDNSGNEVYLLSLYDYYNNGTTNQLYLLVVDENGGSLIALGDMGEGNVMATIYEADVDMDSLASLVAASAGVGSEDGDAAIDGDDWSLAVKHSYTR